MAFDFISNLFSSRPKTFEDVKVEDLQKERIHLENEERRLIKEMTRMQENDRQLLSEYAAAKAANDPTQQKILGRKLQELRHQIKSQDQRHGVLTKHKRMVSNLLVLKDNQAFFERLGANSILNKMDLVELQSYVEQAAADGELNNEKLETLIATMDETNATLSQSLGDDNLDDFLADLDGEIEEQGLVAENSISDEELEAALNTLEKASPQKAGNKPENEPESN